MTAPVVSFSPHPQFRVARPEPLRAEVEVEEAPALSVREHLCRGLSSVLTASSLTPASGAAGEAAEHRVRFSSSLSSRTGELNTSLASSCNASSFMSSSRPCRPTLSGLPETPRRGEGVEALRGPACVFWTTGVEEQQIPVFLSCLGESPFRLPASSETPTGGAGLAALTGGTGMLDSTHSSLTRVEIVLDVVAPVLACSRGE